MFRRRQWRPTANRLVVAPRTVTPLTVTPLSVVVLTVAAFSVTLVAGACGGSDGAVTEVRPDRAPTTVDDLPPAVRRIVDGKDAPAVDRLEVWVCQVPIGTTHPRYGGFPLRLPLAPDDLVTRTGPRLAEYFTRLSDGRTTVELLPGGTVVGADPDPATDCTTQALDGSATTADGVVVVADAEHTATSPGGWGSAGSWPTCDPATADCSARSTRRALYLGASDFHPDWGDVPALDLLQHEIGHLLDLPHSGDVAADGAGEESGHTSALDVMSNSAAPRDVDPTRLDGPGTLAINRLALGWLPVADVVVAAAEPSSDRPEIVDLVARGAEAGPRLLVLPLDEHRALTVELIVADGDDAHLPADGIAVHLVDDSSGTGVLRRQQTLVSAPPHTELLGDGGRATVEGWTLEVLRLDGDTTQVAVTRTDRSD